MKQNLINVIKGGKKLYYESKNLKKEKEVWNYKNKFSSRVVAIWKDFWKWHNKIKK